MRPNGVLPLVLSSMLASAIVCSLASPRQDKVIHEIDSWVVGELFQKWGWQNRESFGGSFPGWAYPGCYKGCQFFVQGGEKAQAKFEIRMQRHPQPHLTPQLVDWATRQQSSHKNLKIFAEKNFGFEISFLFDLGAGMTESRFKKQLARQLDSALPIVKRLNGGKY